ncbi:MAG: L-threonylcarbamoyladenylate synthase [Allosphingosinicella sp.]|uniref:L-threonylcarbamoyladenylate synthase n=1 Tax=Allosphingosinicella sp. TaxID=2823234 RepID=UPI0039298B05
MDPQNTRIVPYGPEAIAEAAALVRAGIPVAVPTETVYGLAADATSGEAVARIYAAKGRPSFNPLIVHVPGLAEAERIALFDDTARDLARRFWPGPLTLVLPLRPEAGIAGLVTAGLPTVAVRAPAHPAMRDLLAAAGRPLAAPSANASGRISPTRARHVADGLAGRVALVIDGGSSAIGLESTIVAPADGEVRLLRPGPVTAAELGVAAAPAPAERIEAPGQMASHYAPRQPLRLDARTARPGEWLIGYGDIEGDDHLGAKPVEAAARLFEALHRAEASGQDAIAVAPIPEEGLGAAINDRLRRAAAPR